MASFSGRDLNTTSSAAEARELSVTSGKRGIVLAFLSASCPCSNAHIETLKALQKKYPDFQFLGVNSNTNESLEVAGSYFQSKSLSFPVIKDRDAKIADQFRASKTPHVFVLNPEGDILYRGGVTGSSKAESTARQYLEEALSDIQGGVKVRTPEARTLGCAIDRGDK